MIAHLIQITILLFYCIGLTQAQTIQLMPLSTEKTASFRGLHVLNDELVWICGNQSTVGKSTNGGITWQWMKGFPIDTMDFRDIHAWDENNALVMKAGWPAEIWKTTDGGMSWKKVLEDNRKGMFLDAIDFLNPQLGAVLGDPIDGHYYISITTDGGNTWKELNKALQPLADTMEYAFAASGSCLQWVDQFTLMMITGGLKSRIIFIPTSHGSEIQTSIDIAGIAEGKSGTGAYSMTLRKNGDVLVCGGDYEKPDERIGCLTYVIKPHLLWPEPIKVEKIIDPPGGYRSCIKLWTDNYFLVTGINGTEWYEIRKSKNGPSHLKQIYQWKVGFHVIDISPTGNVGYLAGKGQIFKAIIKTK
ncbi:MAG: hypothetical protein N2167_02710 [Flavobacteriales bacterium]|nr:hypothetical protein [Flavobacteriales bacterium]